jgi:hypothetical protein
MEKNLKEEKKSRIIDEKKERNEEENLSWNFSRLSFVVSGSYNGFA